MDQWNGYRYPRNCLSDVSVRDVKPRSPRLARWTSCNFPRLRIHAFRLGWLRMLLRQRAENPIVWVEISALLANHPALDFAAGLSLAPSLAQVAYFQGKDG